VTASLIALLLTACSSDPSPAPSPAPPPPPTRPDIVLVTLDTTRADRLGSYGYAEGRTDWLDAKAAAGMRFSRAYSVQPLTIPSHSSIMTGLWPWRHGVRSNGDAVLPDDVDTLAERLAGGGYQTAASVGAFVTSRTWGFSQGFQSFYDELPERPKGPGQAHAGVPSSGDAAAPPAGEPSATAAPAAGEGPVQQPGLWHQERRAEQVVDDAIGWLQQARADQPLFLWVHLYDVHFPYAPPDAYTADFGKHPYDGELAYVDDQLQRLEQALNAAGRTPLWVISGDHGESLGDHREINHGLFVYDSTQHVPLIIAGPGVEPQVVDQPVSQVDIVPTVLSLAGRPVPDDVDGQVQPGHPHPVWMESFQLVEQFGYAPHLGVVDGDFKLIDKPKPELYRLTDDPGERQDLAASLPDEVARMKAAVAALSPQMPEHRTEALDPDALARLQALGYVTASTFDVDFEHLPDPADKREIIAKVLRADAIGQGNPARAVELMQEAAAAEPDQARMQVRLARVMRAAGQPDAATTVLKQAVAHFPDDPEVMLHAATAAGIAGDDAESLALGQRALALDPDNARVAELVAGAMLNLGQRAELASFAEDRLAAHPDEAGLRALQGIALFDLGRISDAEKALRMAAQSSRPRPGVCQRLGSLALAAGVLDDAERWLLREADLHGMSLRTRAMLVDVWSRKHDRDKVLDNADLVLAERPEAGDVWLAKVIALFDEGRVDDAAAAVEQALGHLPDDPDLLLMQANILHKQGREEDARAVKQRADAAHAARIEELKRQAAARKAAAGANTP